MREEKPKEEKKNKKKSVKVFINGTKCIFKLFLEKEAKPKAKRHLKGI